MRTIAHVTHEAVQKIGGIGAVLEGLLTSKAYRDQNYRSILIGPYFAGQGGPDHRLGASGEVLYSSMDGITKHPASEALDSVRRHFHVGIIYGHRTFSNPHNGARVSPEVLLIDISHIDTNKINNFKWQLWDAYGIDSSQYEDSWEYEQYVRLAQPALAILRALDAAGPDNECVIFSHEFMGMPTALAGQLDPSGFFRTVFYAHEVSCMRRIVEQHAGHDVTFYNVLSAAMQNGHYVDDVFGSQDRYFRHALVKASAQCNKIFAVGDYVAKELRFIGPDFAEADIDITYNGIPSESITLKEKGVSQSHLKDYAEVLLGDRPDYVFTHVTRCVTSKGLWRNIRVLEHLEPAFRKQGKSAVLFVLSTEVPSRDPNDIRAMERWWRWPVAHREGDPDLSGGEALFYQGVQEFNARSRQIKIVYVNQFGWERALCGNRMPANMQFADIRRGSDVEFGQSIYEPFGIAQLESLTFGGICVISEVCGCAGFVDRVTGGQQVPNVIIGDYCNLGSVDMTEKELLAIDREKRDSLERQVAGTIAKRLLEVLPRDDASTESLLVSGYALAQQMSWEVVAKENVLPGVEAICRRWPRVHVA